MVQVIKSTAEFNALLAGTKVIVVDFHATWCGPCKVIAPKFEEFSKKFTTLTFVKVDVDELPDVAAKCEVRAMPTFQIYKGGNKVGEVVGADPVKLEGEIKKHI